MRACSVIRATASLAWLVLVVAMPCSAALPDREPATVASWQRLDGSHVRVTYRRDAPAARRVLEVAEALFQDAARKFHIRTDRRIDIWLTESSEQFQGVIHAPIQDWAIGYAFPSEGRIVLRNPTGSDRFDELVRLTRHEVAHIGFGLLVGERARDVPLWFHEGFAMYVAEPWTLMHQWTLLIHAVSKGLLPLESLKAKFPAEGGQVRLAYVESFAAVRWLIAERSYSQFLTLLERLGTGEAFDDAFRSSFGFTPMLFSYEWQKSAMGAMQWAALLGGSLILWGFVSPFLWIGYRRYRRDREARLKAWEEQESQPDAFFR